VIEAPVEARGDALIARFPRSFVAPAALATLRGRSAAAMRAWAEAMRAQGNNQFLFRLQAAPRAAGSGELEIRLTNLAGEALDAEPLRVRLAIDPGPRMPLVPSAPADASRHARLRRLTDAQKYPGNAVLFGFIGFDAPYAELAEWLLDAATVLARRIARGGPLQIHITAAGTHPEVSARFGPEHHLASDKAFALVAKHLAVEADVKVQHPYDDRGRRDGSFVRVRHQPRGTTIFDADTRARLAELGPSSRIVPLDLFFAVARPSAPEEGAALGDLVDRLFVEAADFASCVGGFVGPVGEAFWDDVSAYEQVAGTHSGHDHVDVVRRHVRSPGWRVIVPREATASIDDVAGIARTDHAAGALLRAPGKNPFLMSDADREASERAVLRAVASRAS
jgi:hypothetical protein